MPEEDPDGFFSGEQPQWLWVLATAIGVAVGTTLGNGKSVWLNFLLVFFVIGFFNVLSHIVWRTLGFVSEWRRRHRQ